MLAIPLFGVFLVDTAVDTWNGALVGRLGSAKLTAAGIGSGIIAVYASFLMVLPSISVVYFSEAISEGDAASLDRHLKSSLLSVFLLWLPATPIALLISPILNYLGYDYQTSSDAGFFGICLALALLPLGFFSVIDYLFAAAGRPLISLYFSLGGAVVHSAISMALVFGVGNFSGMGLQGCGFALVISSSLVCITTIMLAPAYLRDFKISPVWRFRPNATESVGCMLMLSLPRSFASANDSNFLSCYRIGNCKV
jgi:MATE family multidrug resistance protein